MEVEGKGLRIEACLLCAVIKKCNNPHPCLYCSAEVCHCTLPPYCRLVSCEREREILSDFYSVTYIISKALFHLLELNHVFSKLHHLIVDGIFWFRHWFLVKSMFCAFFTRTSFFLSFSTCKFDVCFSLIVSLFFVHLLNLSAGCPSAWFCLTLCFHAWCMSAGCGLFDQYFFLIVMRFPKIVQRFWVWEQRMWVWKWAPPKQSKMATLKTHRSCLHAV